MFPILVWLIRLLHVSGLTRPLFTHRLLIFGSIVYNRVDVHVIITDQYNQTAR